MVVVFRSMVASFSSEACQNQIVLCLFYIAAAAVGASVTVFVLIVVVVATAVPICVLVIILKNKRKQDEIQQPDSTNVQSFDQIQPSNEMQCHSTTVADTR